MSGLTDPSRILFQLTGSIACYKACEVISALVQKGHEVQTVCTRAALDFIGEGTLEGLSGKPVFTDAHESGRRMDHIHLARWADLSLVCPATANTLNRLSAGLADDPIGALFLAHEWKKPFLIAPAMNQAMWRHPATQSSVEKLQGWGVEFLLPTEGRQACGETGPGRLLEPEAILARISDTMGADA